MECYVHVGTPAVGACVSCGRFVCDVCRVTMDGRIFCKSCLEKGARAPAPAEGYEEQPARPFRRSRSDRMIAGLCAPIAERMGLDPTLVRVLWLLLALFTGTLLAWVYLILWIVTPQEP